MFTRSDGGQARPSQHLVLAVQSSHPLGSRRPVLFCLGHDLLGI